MAMDGEAVSTSRVIVVESGGDWADASYIVLELKPGVDLDAEKDAYAAWLRQRTALCRQRAYGGERPRDVKPAYESFDERLVRLGLATLLAHETVHPE